MSAEQKALQAASPHRFKLRFIYRKFHFDFTPLSKDTPTTPKVDLPNITASPHVLGLILTYHINYGLPLRKTAARGVAGCAYRLASQASTLRARSFSPKSQSFLAIAPSARRGDPVSREFRPLKQTIERLNRTFKGNYKPMGGFSADFGAIANVTFFVAYFNQGGSFALRQTNGGFVGLRAGLTKSQPPPALEA
jgi:hypothetical protein